MSESFESKVRPRRLTTILAADVVNYSGLMAADEEGTLNTLKAFRGTFEKMFERHGGRLFNTAGDSIMSEFGSAVEAVRCAIAIQDELQLQNAELESAVQMQFRIGVNIGDVLVDEDNLYGDGVNVAARLEALAPPGGICASASVYEFVKGKVSFEFEDIGLQSVKNIPEPVRAYRLEPRDESGARPAVGRGKRQTRSRRVLAGGAALVVLILAGLGIAWTAGVNLFGADAPPNEISKAQALRMKPYVGMTVYGKANRYQKMHFTMRLLPNGVAKLARRTTQADRIRWANGRWFITKSGSLCVDFLLFAGGRTICRRLLNRAGEVIAVAFNPKFPPWILKK